MTEFTIPINQRQYLELHDIGIGVFDPVDGFMSEDEFSSVVESMRLPNGSVFPLPVVLDLTDEQAQQARKADKLKLTFEGTEVGGVEPSGIFSCDKKLVAEKVFGTNDENHPGVAHFLAMGDSFVGGAVHLKERMSFEFSDYDLTPVETKRHFADKEWNTVVGFQTRNVPHRAHEHLLRLGLEMADGLFIQPLVGRKKQGDYSPSAILTSYRKLIDDFLPSQRILLGVLSTWMRYAGPREALFHAIIRRNYGCTHFIVGRDHAGVGNYYGLYEAQDLAKKYQGEIGIEILRMSGPYYCRICDGIVTERTCPHMTTSPDATKQISGTDMRAILSDGAQCPEELMRPAIVDSIKHLPIFITEDEE